MKKLLAVVGLLVAGPLVAVAGELEYVESLGTGVFDTGVVPCSKTRMVLDFQFTDSNLAACEMGWASGGSADSLTVGISANQKFTTRCSSSYSKLVTIGTADLDRHVWDLASGSQKFDGREYATDTLSDGAVGYANRSIWFFTRHQGWDLGTNSSVKGRLYSCKFYEGETLVKDYVPWTQDGEFGLYDRVNDLFIAFEPADFTAPAPAVTADRDLEYVASSGSQYIDTGVVPTSKTRIDIDFRCMEAVGYIFGWMSSGNKESFTFYCQSGDRNKFLSICDETNVPVEVPASIVDRHLVSMTSGSQKLDGFEYATTTFPDWAEAGQTIAIFGRHTEWGGGVSNFSKIKLYGCKIWENGELIRNYVPILRNGVAGFLETKSGAFVQADGTLIAGPAKYAVRPYVETSKSQYVDTGVIPSKRTRFVLDTAFTDLTGVQVSGWMNRGNQDEYLFGVNGSSFVVAISNFVVNPPQVMRPSDTARHVWDISDGSQKIDGVEYATMSLGEIDAVQGAFYIGVRNQGWGGDLLCQAAMRIYGCKIYDDGKLVRDYVPALSNRVAGLYERIQGRFCASPTAKPFAIGPAATPVASVDFPNGPYCDTGVVPGSKVKVVSDMRFLALTQGQMGWVSAGNKEALVFSITGNGYFGGYVGDNYTSDASFGIPADKKRHLWKFSSGEQIISSGKHLDWDRLVGTATIGDTAQAGQTIYLGTRHQGWGGVGARMSLRSYGLRAYTDGELTTDLVPAIVRGKPCLYDTISHTANYSLDTLYSLGWNAQIDKDRYGLAISVK